MRDNNVKNNVFVVKDRFGYSGVVYYVVFGVGREKDIWRPDIECDDRLVHDIYVGFIYEYYR